MPCVINVCVYESLKSSHPEKFPSGKVPTQEVPTQKGPHPKVEGVEKFPSFQKRIFLINFDMPKIL